MRDAALLREAWTFLGVDRLATAEEIRVAWKRKLKNVHPDVGGTKEAAQHATNMRDVLVAWIEAGRPDLGAEPQSDYAANARSHRQSPSFVWRDVRWSPPAYSWNASLSIAAVWGIALLLTVLLAITDNPRNGYKWTRAYQSNVAPGRYGLPICTGMDIFQETRAMLNGKCWDR
jgi:hypothetical protein